MGICSWHNPQTERSIYAIITIIKAQLSLLLNNKLIWDNFYSRGQESVRTQNSHCFSSQKNIITMCDIQVIITDAEYRFLKQAQGECNKLKNKVAALENDLWKSERQNKEKTQVIDTNKIQIKELSKNAINLAKKVLASEDLLACQEDKWLARQRGLLEKLMTNTKVKEQIEEGWKREKQVMRVQEQKYQDSLSKIGQLAKQEKQKQAKWQKKSKKYEKEINQLQQTIIDIESNNQENLNKMKNKLQLVSSQLAKLTNEHELASLKLTERDLRLAQNQHQIEQHVQEANQLKAENQELKRTLSDVRNYCQKEINIIRLKYDSKSSNLSVVVKSVLAQMNSIRTGFKQINKTLNNIKYQQENAINHINVNMIQLQNKTSSLLQQESEAVRALKQMNQHLEKQALENSGLMAEQIKDYQGQLLQVKSKLQILEDKNHKSTKKTLELVSRVKQLQVKLSDSNKKRLSIEEEDLELRKRIQYLNHELLKHEEQSANQRQEEKIEMTTEVIQLQQEALFAASNALPSGPQFKQDVDSLWNSIQRFLIQKRRQLEQIEEIQQLTDQILRQEFKLMMQRFTYNFEQKYLPSLLK